MSLTRRWLDPIRSRWFFGRPYRQWHLSSREGITVYLRFDDAYSYLLVQMLPQLEELLVAQLKPLKVVLCSKASSPPNGLTAQQWQSYMLHDAAVLADQHRFIFDGFSPDDGCFNNNVSKRPISKNSTSNSSFSNAAQLNQNKLPDPILMQQATDILNASPLRGNDYLHLLQDVFHMLWQHQKGKLNTLHHMAMRRQSAAMSSPTSLNTSALNAPPLGLVPSTTLPLDTALNASNISFVDEPIQEAFLLFGGRYYRGIDDFLRLTRRLKRQKLLISEPIFLINHIEWGEHLVNDPESLSEIQALHATLDIYLALEDPISWLILAYLKRELVDYYKLTLRVYPLPYQGRDDFDWGLIARLARRTEVDIAPFCRPTQPAVLNLASILCSVDEDERGDVLLDLLKKVWCKGFDASFSPHVHKLQALAQPNRQAKDQSSQQHQNQYENQNKNLADLAKVQRWLDSNQVACQAYGQPNLPLMVLQIGEQQHVFNSLYRIWRIESLLAQALETD